MPRTNIQLNCSQINSSFQSVTSHTLNMKQRQHQSWLMLFVFSSAVIQTSCSSITNIYVSPYEDYPVGEQSLEWRYETQTLANSVDPQDWDTLDSESLCSSGLKQSPIDIETEEVISKDDGAVIGTMFDDDVEGAVTNTGRMIQFVSLGYARPTIQSPMFGSKTYAFSHIDFHFGSDSSQGSEHSLDGKFYPMEMQLIFYDGSLKSMSEVSLTEADDSLVAISFFFEVVFTMSR